MGWDHVNPAQSRTINYNYCICPSPGVASACYIKLTNVHYTDDIPQYNCSPLKRFDLQMHFNYIKRILWLLWALVQYIAPLNHNCTFCRVYNDAFKKSTFFVSIHRALVWLAVLVAAELCIAPLAFGLSLHTFHDLAWSNTNLVCNYNHIFALQRRWWCQRVI